MPTGVPLRTPSSFSALANLTTSRCRSAKVIVRRSSSGSPSQWYATLSPFPAATCLSTQLKQTLSLPPRYHFAYGGSHPYSLENGSNHVRRSRPPSPRTPPSRARRCRAAHSPVSRTGDPARSAVPRGASCRSCSSRRQVVRVVREHLVAVVGDEDDVLQAEAAEPGAIQARLDRDDVAGDELVSTATERGQLVHLEPDTVAETVEEPILQHFAGVLVQLCLVAGLVKLLAHSLEQRAPIYAGLDARRRGLERALHERVPLLHLLRRLADDV